MYVQYMSTGCSVWHLCVRCSMFSMGHMFVVKMLGNALSNLCVVICNMYVCTVIQHVFVYIVSMC